jgi:hypothetical protein
MAAPDANAVSPRLPISGWCLGVLLLVFTPACHRSPATLSDVTQTAGTDADSDEICTIEQAVCTHDTTVPDVSISVSIDASALDAQRPSDDVPDTAEAVIVIDATVDLGTVNREIFGTNFEYIGADVPEIESIVAGTPLIRFPGGDDVSQFLWSDPDPGRCDAPQWTWPRVADLAARHDIALFLETNLVRDTPQGVTAWILDAVQRGLRVSWIGIGNEVWGDWDAGYRTAARYVQDVRSHAQAIRAQFPQARIVAEIGLLRYDSFNRQVIRETADVIDAVDYHYYPNKQSQPDPMDVAAGADGIAPLTERLRTLIRDVAPDRADHIGIILGEWDGAADGARYPPVEPNRAFAVWSMADALFYGAAIGEMLHARIAAAAWYEFQGYRFGGVPGRACLPADYRIRRPKELAVRLWREHFGERLLSTRMVRMPTFVSAAPTQFDGFAGEAPLVRVYASLAEDRSSLKLIAVNRSADREVSVRFDLQGFEPEGHARAWQIAGDSIMASNENIGGPVDAVRIESFAIDHVSRSWVFHSPAHSVTALEIAARTEM